MVTPGHAAQSILRGLAGWLIGGLDGRRHVGCVYMVWRHGHPTTGEWPDCGLSQYGERYDGYMCTCGDPGPCSREQARGLLWCSALQACLSTTPSL